jgi:hypothetical protein
VRGIIAAYCAEDVRVFHIPSEYFVKIVDDIGFGIQQNGTTSSNAGSDNTATAPDLPKGLARSNFFESPRHSEVEPCSDSSTESDAFLF